MHGLLVLWMVGSRWHVLGVTRRVEIIRDNLSCYDSYGRNSNIARNRNESEGFYGMQILIYIIMDCVIGTLGKALYLMILWVQNRGV